MATDEALATTAGQPTGQQAPTSGTTASDFDRYIVIWSKAVDTQMHFNEMSVKSRQLGLTFVAAALGVAVVLMSEKKDYSINVHGWFSLHVAVLIVLGAAGAIFLVRILDLGVYHRMLRGAVAFGEELELLKLKPALGVEHGMTQAVSLFSRYKDAQFDLKKTPRYTTPTQKITAEDKIKGFYRWAIGGLITAAGLLFAVTFSPDNSTTTSHESPPTAAVPVAAPAPAAAAPVAPPAPAALTPRGNGTTPAEAEHIAVPANADDAKAGETRPVLHGPADERKDRH